MKDDNISKKIEEVSSPCIRNCCLNNDDICLGCFRHLKEITGWQNASNEKKLAILTTCQQRREQSDS
jgi:predicted Fe-S protein YdhL (DUF1289 family)